MHILRLTVKPVIKLYLLRMCVILSIFNPPLTTGLSHPYHLDVSTFNFGGIGSDFSFSFHFSIRIMKANRIVPYAGTPRFAASHLGLFCLPMSHKKDARLYMG